MREFKGTKGPWRLEAGTNLVWGACNPDDTTSYGMGIPVAEARVELGKTYDYELSCVNARLIAAAPDLLHALRCLASNAKCLRAFETDMRYSVGNTNYQCLMESVEQADAAIAKALQP